jgi:hypothetical protein
MSKLSLALITAVIVIVAAIGVYVLLSSSLIQSSLTNNYTSFATNSHTTNSSLGLELHLSLNSSVIKRGQAINVTLAISNILHRSNNVSGEWAWSFPILADFGYSAFPCPEWYNFVIFSSYYSANNISIASNALHLFPPGVGIPCPYLNFSQFIFQPLSSNFNTSTSEPPNFDRVFSSNETFSIIGYYTTGQGYVNSNKISPPPPFPLGVYTIMAGDEWRQIVILHFAIIS